MGVRSSRSKTRRRSDGGYSGFVRGWMGSEMGDCWIPVKDTVCEDLEQPLVLGDEFNSMSLSDLELQNNLNVESQAGDN